jgi:hypothetical protein
MANTELLIKITAQDGASAAFKTVGTQAQQMGTQVEQAGKRSTTAMQAMRAGAENYKRAGLALGASAASFARSARDQAQELRTLQRTYGDAADGLRDFADELQRTTTYSNDAAIEAANTFGTLERNYGLTADQIQNLITVTADLAAANGIGLAEAAERVQAAIRGEAESAEMLGLTMNDAAIGLVGISANMTDAEKAAYRYNALLEQSAFATGAAGEAAETASGRVNQLLNEVEDAATGFMEFTGPVGGIVAGLSDASLQIGLAAGGFVELGRGAKAASDAMGLTAKASGVMKSATGLLSAAVGPAGLALAAGVAVYALWELGQEQERQRKAARAAAEANLELADSIKSMAVEAGAGTQVAADLETIGKGLEALGPAFGDSILAVDEFIGTLGSARDEMVRTSQDGQTTAMDAVAWLEGFDPADPFVAAVQATTAWNTAISETSPEGALLTVEELDAIIQELTTDYNLNAQAAETMGQAHDLIQKVMDRATESGVDTAAVYGQVADAIDAFMATGDATTLLASLTAIEQGIGQVGVGARQANQTMLDLQKVMTDAWTAVVDPLAGVEDALTRIFSSGDAAAYGLQQSINGTTGAVGTLENTLATAGLPTAVYEDAKTAFYDTASAVEILNYELDLAGYNVAAQDQAWRNFRDRVEAADQALRASEIRTLITDLSAGDAGFLDAASAWETFSGALEATGPIAAQTAKQLQDIALVAFTTDGAAAAAQVADVTAKFDAGEISAQEYAQGVALAAQGVSGLTQEARDAIRELNTLNDVLAGDGNPARNAATDTLQGILELDTHGSAALQNIQDRARAAGEALQQALTDGNPSNDARAWALFELQMIGLGQQVDVTTEAINAQGRAWASAWENAAGSWTAMATANQKATDSARESEQQARDAEQGAREWGYAWRDGMRVWGQMAATGTAAMDGAAATTDDATDSLADFEAQAWAAAEAVGLVDSAAEKLQAQFPKNLTIDVAVNAQRAGEALDTAFRVIVGNTNGILSQNDAIMAWADELINVEGVHGRIDDLLASGAINQEQYNAAQRAYNRMAAVRSGLEEDILTIQAKQAPVLDDMMEAQAEYVSQIAEMDGRQQLAALGFMDSAESAKAMELAMFAAAAASGQLGDSGLQMAEDIIYGAAMADPVLAAMLEQMGLMSIGADGTVTVTIDGEDDAKSMQDTLDDLALAVENLGRAIRGLPPLTELDVVVTTTYRNQGGQQRVMAAGGTTTWDAAMAMGGTVTSFPKYAMAQSGRTTLVGEAGPEMLWLPGGAQVTSAPATRDRLRSGAGRSGSAVNFYGPVTLAPAGGDVAAAIRREALASARGY